VDTGDLLGSLTLPRAWMTDAIDGVMTMSDLWSSGVCSGTGEPGHFRVKSNGACHIQGSVSDPDGDGEMIVSDLLFVVGRVFTVIGFALTAGNGGR
jgi:hypothetical protein